MNQDDITGFYADCYVLLQNRSQELVEDFLNHFVPNRAKNDTIHTVDLPEWYYYLHDEKSKTFNSDKDLFSFLEEVDDAEYSIYFHNLDNDRIILGAMIFYTKDKCLILGLWCDTLYANTEVEDKVFSKLKDFTKTDLGYITYEDLPMMSYNAFLRKMNELKKA